MVLACASSTIGTDGAAQQAQEVPFRMTRMLTTLISPIGLEVRDQELVAMSCVCMCYMYVLCMSVFFFWEEFRSQPRTCMCRQIAIPTRRAQGC